MMKTRSEILIDIICSSQERISTLKGEIMKLEEDIKVARANLKEVNKETKNGKDL